MKHDKFLRLIEYVETRNQKAAISLIKQMSPLELSAADQDGANILHYAAHHNQQDVCAGA